MADVARALGVHQTTVSLALRNHRSIPPATRERVQAMADKMGYRPNPLVSALIAERKSGRITSKGSTLAFLTCFPQAAGWRHSPNYVTVHEELQVHAASRGYRIEEFWLMEPGMTPVRMKDILLNRGIRGVIVCPMPSEPRSLTFDFSEFAAVSLGLTLQKPLLDRVAIDYSAVMNLCVKGLKERNCRRIGFATTYEIDSRVNHLSLGAFLAERYRDPKSFLAPLTLQAWEYNLFSTWLQKNRPDAVITAISPDYFRLHQWLQRESAVNLSSLSLVCVDCMVDEPGQGGVVQNLAAEAKAAVDFLTSRVERAQFGLPNAPQTILVSGSWRNGAALTKTPATV